MISNYEPISFRVKNEPNSLLNINKICPLDEDNILESEENPVFDAKNEIRDGNDYADSVKRPNPHVTVVSRHIQPF